MQPHLLIDARNLLYRTFYSNQPKDGRPCVHHAAAALRFVHQWLVRFNPRTVGVFWDASGADLWRKKLLETYKDRDEEARADAREALRTLEPIMQHLFSKMGVFQFAMPTMEADDLIFAACRVLSPADCVIISSDNDYAQVSFRMANVKVYDPLKNVFKDNDYDPVILKALMGDKSDLIDGYYGIGPKKGEKMARSLQERQQFLVEKGSGKFLRNMLLIDLSLCPGLLKNIMYVQKQYAKPVPYDRQAVYDLVRQHSLDGLVSDFSRTISPFKTIAESSQTL